MKPPRSTNARSTTSKQAEAALLTPHGVHITPAEGKALRRCAKTTGQTVEAFVSSLILHGIECLDGIDPLGLPCAFCRKTDQLEIINWSQERRDGTEYHGDAVRCHRCEAVVTLAAWMMRGLRTVGRTELLEPRR